MATRCSDITHSCTENNAANNAFFIALSEGAGVRGEGLHAVERGRCEKMES